MCNSLLSFSFAVVLATTAVVLPAAAQLGRGKTATPAAAQTAAEEKPAAAEQPAAEPPAVPHITMEQVWNAINQRAEEFAKQPYVNNLEKRVDALEGKSNWIIYVWLFVLTMGVVMAFGLAIRRPKVRTTTPPSPTPPPAHPQTRMVRSDESREGFGRIGFMAVIGIIGFVVFALSASAAPVCYNSETGKTVGSTKVAVAVVGVSNTFNCSVSGKVVELVDVDTPATVVLTPTVSKNSPLEFEFTPAAEGRLLVKVDGKVYNQLAVRDEKTAISINDAIDLSAGPAPVSNGDHLAREFIRGLVDAACEDGKQCNRDEVLKAVFGPQKGSTRQAGYLVATAARKGAVDAALSDPRLKTAFADALTAFGKNLPTTPAPAVDLSEVNGRLDRLEDGQTALGRKVEAAVATAAEAKADAAAASKAAFSAQQTAGQLRQLLAERGPRGLKKALKATPPPPPAAAAPAAPARQHGAAFRAADK